MILTQCPVCAAPLPDLTAKQCSRCKTRYCGPACQKKHWEEGGHANLCKKIKKGGGAEQYNANKKYAEAVSVAAEACAEDTKGQTCYICTQAFHWKTKEGLVRMCACRGTAGFAHVSCLAEQAKILVAEAEENNKESQWHRWRKRGLCEQQYHGDVCCALGWACWKTYLGRPETDWSRRCAMTELGLGLIEAGHTEDALSVQEAELSVRQRRGDSVRNILAVQGNLVNTYEELGRLDEGLRLRQDVYSGTLKLLGAQHIETLIEANNYADNLVTLGQYAEAKALMRKTIPVARRVLGDSYDLTLIMRWVYAMALYRDDSATLDDLREAATSLEDTVRVARRVLGSAHPDVSSMEDALQEARAALATREGTKIK